MSNKTLFSGLILIITLFISMCIITLSMLTIISIQNETNIVNSLADNDKNYKIANDKASEILVSILEGINTSESNQKNQKAEFNYTVDIDDDKYLDIQLRVEGNTYEIIKWEQVYDGDWEVDDVLQVWDGE